MIGVYKHRAIPQCLCKSSGQYARKIVAGRQQVSSPVE